MQVQFPSNSTKIVAQNQLYVALFICSTTKAIHTEGISDLTTDVFISALSRFSVRRSAPRHIYSVILSITLMHVESRLNAIHYQRMSPFCNT